jgi:hypothetical protein
MAAYRRTSGIDARLLSGEDSDLLFKLEEVAPVHRIDKPLYLYRQLSTSLSKGVGLTVTTIPRICRLLRVLSPKAHKCQNLLRTVVLVRLPRRLGSLNWDSQAGNAFGFVECGVSLEGQLQNSADALRAMRKKKTVLWRNRPAF